MVRNPASTFHLRPTDAYNIAQGEKGLGVTPRSSVSRTRVWPTELLDDWGFKDLPWDRLEMLDEHGLERNYDGIDTRREYVDMSFRPLIKVGQWSTVVASVVEQSDGPFRGCLDVWTTTMPMWLDRRALATGFQVEFLARAAAWCLHERKKLPTERWDEVRKPLAVADIAPSARKLPVLAKNGLEIPAGEISGERPRRLLSIPIATLSNEERVLLASAQGLVNRRGTHLVSLSSTPSDVWAAGIQNLKLVDRVETHQPKDLFDLVGHRRAVVVDPDLFGSLNLATMIASLEGLLIAYPSQIEKHGLEVATDLRGTFSSNVEMFDFAVENVLPLTDADSIGSIRPTPDTWELRDFLVDRKPFLFWVPSVRDGAPNVDRAGYRAKLFDALATIPLGSPAFSWPREPAQEGIPRLKAELRLARVGKRFGDFRRARHLSCGVRFTPDKPLEPFRPSKAVTLDTSKVYVAVVAHETSTTAAIGRTNSRRPVSSSTAPRVQLGARAGVVRVVNRGTTASPLTKPAVYAADAWEPGVETHLPSRHNNQPAQDAKKKIALSYPPGLYLPPSLSPEAFGRAYGDDREGALEGFFGQIGDAMKARGSRFLLAARHPGFAVGDWSRYVKHLPEGSAVFMTYDARTTATTDVIRSTKLVGGIPVVHDLGYAQLREFLSPESLEIYRPLRPFFTFTTAATVARLERDKVRERKEIVFVEPDQLAALAKEYLSNRTREPIEYVRSGSKWRYHDRGKDLGTDWRKRDFDDADWAEGISELGYGDTNDGRPEATAIEFGDDKDKKHPCYYFRTSFEVDSTSKPARFVALELLADDGAVV